MGIVDLVWYLNVNDSTKYMMFLGFFVCIFLYCFVSGKKRKKPKKKKTGCQKSYDACMSKNRINGTNNFCYPCFDDGQAPDFFYDSNIGQLRTNQ